MAAPSFTLFTWATTGTPAQAVLTSGLQTNGWADFDQPTAAQHNRQLYELTQYVTWLAAEAGTPFALEHYSTADTDALGNALAAGAHKDITCDSLQIRALGSGASQGGTLSFPQAGSASDNRALISLGALGSGDCILNFDHPANNSIELELSGGVWRSTLAGGATWAFEANSGSNRTLYIRNIGAGTASLDVDGGATVAGQVTLMAGLEVTGPDASTDIRYGYGGAVQFLLDMSPLGGGYTVSAAGAGGLLWAAGPPDIAYSATLGIVTARRPLRFDYNNTDQPATEPYIIKGASVGYVRGNAASTIRVGVYRVPKASGASRTAVFEWDETTEFTTDTGSYTIYTNTSLSHQVEADLYIYYVEFEMDPDTAAQNAALSKLDIVITKSGVE